jgi:hypothetical protein
VTPSIKPDDAVKFLREAARYFERRDTGGEDMAFWANVKNAETCQRIADLVAATPKAKMKPIRTYEISVDGWGEAKYSARSPGKARARAYSDWSSAAGSSCTFGEFLTFSTVRRVPDPPGCGDRIVVSGETVTRVYHPLMGSNYVYFMRDDGDAVLSSHPSDVSSATAVLDKGRAEG